ncbi:MAG: hypothetical protein I3270_02480 [Candidatus Moeniiplasma glomeromycotorum]|nr:hypothetical protein [Candidatus Moeniiplasma glomeromycotorum]MCE8162587.1 hypothetical protein [Candidatus Moeniiplasma glomeromycotorum]MCE8166489.1 hypothetical protein [Candidatus Moeniiplasma glomeromycotorum]MCE8166970.1 hypothetical protein [Candidatus Moeniiplasma glomeromycotorum]
MLLSDYFYLGYVNISDLLSWVKTNQLTEEDFSTEKNRWGTEINKEPNFFSDTELLLLADDILILKVAEDSQVVFLAQTYQLEQQNFCQKLFSENKHIILLSERQWGQFFQPPKEVEISQTDLEKAIVLLKDEASIKKSFTNWLARKNLNN